jgi:hypothetical protein
VQVQIKSLEEVLTSVLPLPPMSFDRLMATPQTPAFDPGPLGVAAPGPDWSAFAPAKPGGLLRFLGRTARFKRQAAQARDRFEAATAEHREHESRRQLALAGWLLMDHRRNDDEPGQHHERHQRPFGRKSSHGCVMLPVTVHSPNVKIGCQKLRGQKKTEMKYCIQLWSDAKLAAVDGIWGGAVLWKTPIRM